MGLLSLLRPQASSSARLARSDDVRPQGARPKDKKSALKLRAAEDSSAPKRKKGKWKKRFKSLKKLVSRSARIKPDSVRQAPHTPRAGKLFKDTRVEKLKAEKKTLKAQREAGKGEAEKKSAKQSPAEKALDVRLKNATYSESFLPALIQSSPASQKKIAALAGEPIEKIKEDINALMLLSVKDTVNAEAAQTAYEEVVQNGKDIGEVLPDFQWKEEFSSLYQTQEFVAQLETEQKQIGELARKMDNGTADLKDCEELSELLHASQTNLAVAQTHLGEMFARHAARASQPGSKPILSLGIIAQGLSQRLADHHMDVADIISKCGTRLPAVQTVRPKDQLNRQLLEAQGLLYALKWQSQKAALENPKLNAAIENVEVRVDYLKKQFITHQKITDNLGDGSVPLRDKLVDIAPAFLDLGLAADLMPSADMIARGRVHATNQAQWPTIENDIQFHADGQAHNYNSVTEPAGSGVALRFGHAYQGGQSYSPQNEYDVHAPNLARSALQTDDGLILFQANRHAALNAEGITPEYLKQLPADELKYLLANRYWDANKATTDNPTSEVLAANIALRYAPDQIAPIAQEIQSNVHEAMGREIIAATLIADGDRFKQALEAASLEDDYDPQKNTKVITVPINAISLMTPAASSPSTQRESAHLTTQLAGLRAASNNGEPFMLPVGMKSREGTRLVFVPIKVELRQFNFAVEPAPRRWHGLPLKHVPLPGPLARYVNGWGYSTKLNNPALTSLLGDRKSEKLEGAVGARLEFLQSQRTRFVERRDITARIHADKGNSASAQELFVAEKKIESIDYEVDRIIQCAAQVKDIWRAGKFRSEGGEPHKLVSRLALLCSAIGESPSISDINGLDRVNRCDAEAKYLAAAFDATGALPLPDEAPDPQRAIFAQRSGGTELRRYNDGLPG